MELGTPLAEKCNLLDCRTMTKRVPAKGRSDEGVSFWRGASGITFSRGRVR